MLSDDDVPHIAEATKRGDAVSELADNSVVVENVFPDITN